MYPYGILSEKIKVQNCHICVSTKMQKNNNKTKTRTTTTTTKNPMHVMSLSRRAYILTTVPANGDGYRGQRAGRNSLILLSVCIVNQKTVDPSPQWHLIKNNTPVAPDYLIRSKSCEAISQQWNHCLLKIWVPPLDLLLRMDFGM